MNEWHFTYCFFKSQLNKVQCVHLVNRSGTNERQTKPNWNVILLVRKGILRTKYKNTKAFCS